MHLARLVDWGYGRVLKPALFRQDPEAVHERFLAVGEWLGRNAAGRSLTQWFFAYRHSALAQTLAGIDFPNPVGLAAGFDKNARLWRILPAVGFGFMELSSITAGPSAGNPRPRLARWPEGKSLVVNYGLANDGVERIATRLPAAGERPACPLGLSLAFTNTQSIVSVADAVKDYLFSLEHLRNFGDYYTLNISCPNRLSDRLFIEPANLELLLTGVDRLGVTKPIFLKLSPDLNEMELAGVVAVAERHQVTGFISGNLTKNRARLPGSESLPAGGLSGRPVDYLSDKQIRWLYQKVSERFIIIGCGGIFDAHDAYRKIKLGASLVQLVTGMIYGGPQRIGQINRELVTLLKRDGFRNLGEAVGVAA